MSIDLNKVAQKLKNQNSLGVSKTGQLQESDPKNDGTKENKKGNTTLEPKRFF